MPKIRDFQDVLTDLDDGKVHEQLTKLWPEVVRAVRETNKAGTITLQLTAKLERGTIAQPAALVEMARNLIVRTKGEFSRQVNVTTGEASLISKLENESTSTKIPRAFVLGIPVFEGGTLYALEARVRFSMREGRPTFAYSLYMPEKVLKDAFNEVRNKVAADTALPVFAGSPES